MAEADKIIFISAGESVVFRNILQSDFLPALRKALPQVRVVLVVHESLRAHTVRLQSPGLVVETLPTPPISFFERILGTIARNAFYTGTNDVMQRRAWLLGESNIPPILKRTLGRIFGRSRSFQHMVRRLQLLIRPAPSIPSLFEKYQPTLVFSTVIIDTAVDIPLVREARRRGIRVVGMVRSWDNLTSFGFLPLLPDVFIAQNEYLKEMVARLHYMPVERITVVGLPHYDAYLDRSLIMPREKFLSRYGIAPGSKLIVYAAIGNAFFRNEEEIAEIFEEILSGGALRFPAAAIYRTHPSFPMSLGRIRQLKRVIPDDTHGKLMDMPHLINTLAHADVVVTAGSTMMIDAAAFGKPVITVAFDGKSGDSYWFSVARFHDYFTHIKALIERTKGVRVVYTKEELTHELNAYLADPARDAEGRKKIVEQFAAPLDGNSGVRLASMVAQRL